MFDWNAELETAKGRVAELVERVSEQKLELKRLADDGAETVAAERIFAIRRQALQRAKAHVRFVEHRISMNLPDAKPTDYFELARLCLNATKWMDPGEAAEAVRAQGAAFYAKAKAQRQNAQTEPAQ
jgi:hypothetical protein